MAVLRGGLATKTKASLIKRGRSISYVLLAPSGENQGIWKPKANLSVLRPEVPIPSLRGGLDETLLLLWVVFAAPCRLVGPGKLEEKEMDELRTKCWQMR